MHARSENRGNCLDRHDLGVRQKAESATLTTRAPTCCPCCSRQVTGGQPTA